MSRSLTSRLVLQSSQALLPRCSAAAASASATGGSRPFSQTVSRRANPEDDRGAKPPAPTGLAGARKGAFGTSPSPSSPSSSSSSAPSSSQSPSSSSSSSSFARAPSSQSSTMDSLARSKVFQVLNKSTIDTSSLSAGGAGAGGIFGLPLQAGGLRAAKKEKEDELEPFHFHVYAHKHNTHITCTRPNREPIISMSCGNIGFRKSRRGTFDAAYSLTKYVLERLVHTGWPMKISRLELVLQGFGQGREAVIKMLMSPEGKMLRDKIVRVADSTRIKFGGTRSKKPRRL